MQLIVQIRTQPRLALHILRVFVVQARTIVLILELERSAAAHELAVAEEVVGLAEIRGESLVQLIKLVDLHIMYWILYIISGVQQI